MLPYRELYAPAHFGNSYEVMASYEMDDLLREARFWGFNAYGDWLDAADLKNPENNPRHEYLLPQAILDKKVRWFQLATELGFRNDLVMTPNHVYLDQLRPELLANTEGDERFFGQLLCPSLPAGREIILENQRRFFKLLAENGVVLHSLSACPFDYGGCACAACAPWIVTLGKLFVEIHALAREYFPDIAMHLIGWWWTDEEHRQFSAWADAEQAGRFKSLAAHIQYGETQPRAGRALPADCALHAFVHIGYGDLAAPRDVYGAWGPVVAPARIPATVANLHAMGAGGWMAYSEGAFDDVNKALLAGLSSGQYATADEVLTAYAGRYFTPDADDQRAWSRWLAQWGAPFAVDPTAARQEFERLAPRATPNWRLEQWASRLRLFEAHRQVLAETDWSDTRKAAARRFEQEQERLFRDTWKLGLVRHVLNPRFFPPEWYDEWKGVEAGAIRAGTEA